MNPNLKLVWVALGASGWLTLVVEQSAEMLGASSTPSMRLVGFGLALVGGVLAHMTPSPSILKSIEQAVEAEVAEQLPGPGPGGTTSSTPTRPKVILPPPHPIGEPPGAA